MGSHRAAAAAGPAPIPDALIGRLALACRGHLLREKIVVVPDFRSGRQIGEALAREIRGWLNLRFVTLPALAHQAAGEALVAARLKTLGPREALQRIRAVMMELWESDAIPYFRCGSDPAESENRAPADHGPSRGLVRAVHKAVQWLRLDGFSAANLEPQAFTVEGKGRDLRLALQRYEARLSADRELDPPGLFAVATAALAETGGERLPGEPPLVFRFADTRYFKREEDFLRAFSPNGLIELARARVFGLERPRLYPDIGDAGAGSAGMPTAVDSDAARLPWLFAPENAPAVSSPPGRGATAERRGGARDREEAAILCGDLASSGDAPAAPPARPSTIGLFRAVGAANECREILRRVLASKTPLDEVEILTPPGSAYPAMLHLQSLRLEVPMTFAGGLPLEYTKPGRALFGFVDWTGSDYRESVLRRMLEAGEIDLAAGCAGAAGARDVPSGGRAARLLRLARIGWGRDRYALRLAALKAEFETKLRACETGPEAEDDDDDGGGAARGADAEALRRKLRDLDGLSAAAASLIDLVPRADAAGLDFGALCRGALAFVENFAVAETGLDRSARETISDHLRGLIEVSASGPHHAPAARALRRLREEAEGLRTADSPPRPGRLHVSEGSGGGFAGRRVVFVCGLDAASFPGAEHQDPILLDREKERISSRLPTSADLLRERLYDMAALLSDLGRKPSAAVEAVTDPANAPGAVDDHSTRGGSAGAGPGVASRPAPRRIVFSYSGYDVTDERASAPSSLILQVFRLLTGRPEAGYVELEKALGPVASLPEDGRARPSAPGGGFVPDMDVKALDGLDWWLRKIAPDGGMRNALRALKAAYPALDRGWTAHERRSSAELTEFDGRVRIDPDRHQPAGNPDLRVSPSRLEKLADCPYGYFLSHMLGLRPPDDPEYDPARWLDPRERGTLVHEILAEFMSGLKAKRRRLDAGRDRGRLLEIARARLAAWKDKVPPPSTRVFERESADVLEGMEIFLRMEAGRPGRGEPLLFEQAFEDLEVDAGGGRPLRVSGFIDRVDRIGPGRYRVIDYKTGSPRKYETVERFGRGTVLQYALYALAAEKLLEERGEPGEVVEAGYAFPTRKGDGGEVLIPFDREACAEVLGILMEIIEGGLFVPGKDARCEWCDCAPACGRAPVLARAKIPGGRGAEDKAVGAAAKSAVRIFERLKDYK